MNKRAFSVLYMFLITLFFTSLVTAVQVLNEERIKTNQQVKLQKVVLKVLNIQVGLDASAAELVRVFETRVKPTLIQGRTVYTAYDPVGGNPVGYATTMSGPGFWGPISAMVAVDAEVSKIIGLEVFRLQETPGLGARITEPRFEKQFVGLSLALAPGEKTFFSITPPAPGKSARELDAITGATSTSRAVDVFLNSGLQRFLKEFRESNGKR